MASVQRGWQDFSIEKCVAEEGGGGSSSRQDLDEVIDFEKKVGGREEIACREEIVEQDFGKRAAAVAASRISPTRRSLTGRRSSSRRRTPSRRRTLSRTASRQRQLIVIEEEIRRQVQRQGRSQGQGQGLLLGL